MRAHLARNVCRRLLAQHGLALPRAALSGRCLTRCAALSPARPAPWLPPRRTFFGIFQKPPRRVKEPELEPGYETLLEFRSREVDTTRLPATEELVRGFRTFFRYKTNHNRSVNSTQAFCALHLFRHLRATIGQQGGLTPRDLQVARDALLKSPKAGGLKDHLQLSRELYADIYSCQFPELSDGSQDIAKELVSSDFTKYISALTRYGGSEDAAELVAESFAKVPDITRGHSAARALWVLVLQGLAKEGLEKELIRRAQEAEALGIPYSPAFQLAMTGFYARRNKEEDALKWFQKPVSDGQHADPETYLEMFRLCIRNKAQPSWMKQAIQDLSNSNPPRPLWGVIFQWAVLQGKGVEDIKRMIDVMLRLNKSDPSFQPDISTINGLIRAASDKRDFLLADRFILLASELGLKPNAMTYVLQLGCRIEGNDFSGAYESFEKLLQLTSDNGDALSVINKYIQRLCAAQPADVDRILHVTSLVERRLIVLDPETVVQLCKLFLMNDQQYEVIDTLSIHSFHYSLEERAAVRDAFVAYCLDKKNSTARAWDGYSLLRQFFPETDRDARVKLMQAFFGRKRPDMACYVFGHMRAHRNDDFRPDLDIYVSCLEGLGRCPDRENLRMVHNMLKMDTTIQPTTKLYNALMLAFAGCGDAARALDFWHDVSASAEGPSYNSLAIVFRVCESLPFGDQKARDIWAKIQEMDVEVPRYVFAAYCGAIAGQGHVEEAKTLVDGMEASFGYAPDLMTLGVIYNALPGQSLQSDFQEWAKGKYPALWKELQKKGRKKTADDLCRFRIVRELRA